MQIFSIGLSVLFRILIINFNIIDNPDTKKSGGKGQKKKENKAMAEAAT